jgi:hypothetical protein
MKFVEGNQKGGGIEKDQTGMSCGIYLIIAQAWTCKL